MKYNNALLDQMRTIGDPPADRAILNLRNAGKITAVRALLNQLVDNNAVPAQLPQEIQTFWQMSQALAQNKAAKIKKGEEFFADHGPEVILILGFYSLPTDYAARGVRVLRETGRLLNNPTRRVFETMQMVIDVMRPDGLASRGKGLATALKVRLMHAAIRTQILFSADDPVLFASYGKWDHSLGEPINQEDMAGTLMSFSYLILDGLEKLGHRLADDEKNAFLGAWQVIGEIMGIEPALIPATLEEARELTEAITARQIDATEDSREMVSALLEMYQKQFRWRIFSGVPAAMMRFFLPPERADQLGVPGAMFSRAALRLLAPLSAFSDWVMRSEPNRWVFRRFSILLLQILVDVNRGGQRSKFEIPRTLDERWRVSPQFQRPTILQRTMRALKHRRPSQPPAAGPP